MVEYPPVSSPFRAIGEKCRGKVDAKPADRILRQLIGAEQRTLSLTVC